MNKVKYRWFQAYEKEKLEKLLEKRPVLEPIEAMTDHGWKIVDYKLLIDINLIVAELNREPKTIKNELIRGKYLEIPSCIAKQSKFYCYSKDVSDNIHIKTFKAKRRHSLKIYQHDDLFNFVMSHKEKQSLNSIAGRTYIENLSTTISRQTLYNYVDNINVHEIDRSWLIRSKNNTIVKNPKVKELMEFQLKNVRITSAHEVNLDIEK